MYRDVTVDTVDAMEKDCDLMGGNREGYTTTNTNQVTSSMKIYQTSVTASVGRSRSYFTLASKRDKGMLEQCYFYTSTW